MATIIGTILTFGVAFGALIMFFNFLGSFAKSSNKNTFDEDDSSSRISSKDDSLSINPANGNMMIDGMDGFDTSGNSFGSDLY